MKVHVLQLYLLDLRGILLCLLMTQLASAGHSASADLPRFLPNDGNNVYVATGLLRRWPPGGPRELWRSEIGSGKSAIAESAGRGYTTTPTDQHEKPLFLGAAPGGAVLK